MLNRVAVGTGPGQWSCSHTGPGHILELRVTSQWGKGWPNYLMALPAWLQGLFREFLYEGDILTLSHLDIFKLVRYSGKSRLIHLHPKGDVMIK